MTVFINTTTFLYFKVLITHYVNLCLAYLENNHYTRHNHQYVDIAAQMCQLLPHVDICFYRLL